MLATSTVPAPVVAALIEIASRATLPPIIPCIATAPAPVLIVRSRLVLASSELTVAVELKVTLVLFASASIVISPAKVTGPVKAIAPSAAVEVVMSPPKLIPVSPVIDTDLMLLVLPAVLPIVPPMVMVPVPSPPVPSVRVTISSPSVPVIFPAIVISPPPLSTEKVPSTTTFPKKLTSPLVANEPVLPESV